MCEACVVLSYVVGLLGFGLLVLALLMRRLWRRYDRAHWLLIEEVNELWRHMARNEEALRILHAGQEEPPIRPPSQYDGAGPQSPCERSQRSRE